MSFHLGLGLGLTRRGGGGAFSPLSLFEASEPGAWYDPSDLTTLYQNRLGHTPVTAAGQSVGMMLDKSQGSARGAELITDLSAAGLLGTGTWTDNGDGSYTFTDTVGGQSRPGIQFLVNGLTAGTYYECAVTVSATSAQLRHVTSPGGPLLNINTPSGTATFIGTTSGSGTYQLRFESTSTTLGWSFTVSSLSLKAVPGKHAVANSDAARGTYNTDGTYHWIAFDGTDDGYATPTITPGTDKVQVFAGVRKLSDAARGTVLELSASAASNNGAFHLAAPNAASATYAFESKGTTLTDAAGAGTAPITSVLTGLGDISGDSTILRVNGAVAETDTGDQGTGNYLAAAMYLGRRGAASQPFNGRLYQAIVRFGPNLTADQISAAEDYVNGKTGAY